MKENLKSNQLRDQIKNDYCKKNGINLLRIRYDENVEENNYKGQFDKRWILSFRKYNGVEPIGNPTANLHFDTLEEVFNKINE